MTQTFEWMEILYRGNSVAASEVLSANVLLAVWIEDWWRCGVAVAAGVFVFVLLNSSKIAASGKQVAEREQAFRDRDGALQALEESEERFRTLCDHAPVGIFVNDPQGNGIYINPQCAEITGLSLEQSQGSGWHRSIHSADRDAVVEQVNDAVARETPYEACNRYKHSDGTIRWAEGMAVPVKRADGGLIAYIGTLLDVTAQRASVAARQASESRYRAIVNDQTDLIVRWRPDGTLLFANDAWCRFQGCTLDEAIGIDFLSVVPQQRREELRQWVMTVQVDCPVVEGESRFCVPDGRLHVQLWIEHAIFSEQGKLIEIQSVGRDITDEREAEEQFREQQSLLAHVSRLSTMGELVAGIAHEVNQPLYSIKNCAQALQNVLADGGSGDENRDLIVRCADQISEASSRAGEMIRRMRDFVRFGETEREACDLNVLVEEAVRLVAFEARRNQASVLINRADHPLNVNIDRVQIQQVLVNLLKNAFEAMSAANCSQREVVATCGVVNSYARISIADVGVGVPSELQSTIFNAFVTTRREGMGMGLAISRTIVEGHGGRIRLKQGDAAGAVFHVELPLSATAGEEGETGVCAEVDDPQDSASKSQSSEETATQEC